ncbi:SMI1/KNR4 family protein [Crocosphaera chwakensis]|uniref:PBS lyase HEAT-like repeat n=1 Tax=Crocosphaera chwakensis CCY0110 TaxID=391612 RepID=A3IR02_9CHRO|nr:SMI1/KNR4 family protein [Crocosphaera chwakensis]EAZ91207.1 PBS lyase HEAT-like repeat [Crocosphaera chwakensis CCY0110]
MSKLTRSLDEIIHWLKLNCPEEVSQLRRGLSIKEIEEITKDFPFVLPKEVYDLYQFCDGDIMLGSDDLVLYPLKLALEWSPHCEAYKDPCSFDNHILTIMHGCGKDVYYILCDKKEKDYSSVWYAKMGLDSVIYASSLTNLMLTIAECYREGAYYTKFYEEFGYIRIEEDLEKIEKIFQKYNPEQINTWRGIWKD